MKIFLSYGHDDNAEIVKRIKQDLEAKGHQVCIDESENKTGDDWRRSIAEGVQQSQKTLAILSGHTVSDPVCLNRLNISLINGGEHSLVTVLLEAEKEVSPPLQVSHIQWLDFSDWKNQKQQGEAVFEAWYASKFETLAHVLESQKDYKGEIDELRELLHIIPDRLTWPERILRQYGFVGRDWLLDEIQMWLNESLTSEQEREAGRRIFCLIAGPGAGKSAMAAHFATHNKLAIGGLHFCNKADIPQDVLLILAFQLATRLADYRHFLLSTLKDMSPETTLASLPLEELFDFLFIKAAHMTIDGMRGNYLFLLDGLDESDGKIAALLAQKASELPRWLRVLITSRPNDAHVRSYLVAMNPHVLDVSSENNQADVRQWIEIWFESRQVAASQRVQYASKFLQMSGGNFAYLTAFREMVESNPALLENPERYPSGLAALYKARLERAVPNLKDYETKLRSFLCLLCAARRPLPLALAGRLLRKENKELERGFLLEDILPLLGSLIDTRGKGKNAAALPYYKSFADYLQSEESGGYRIHVLNGHETLIRHYYSKLVLEDGRANYARLDAYGQTEFTYHFLMCLNDGENYADPVKVLGLAEGMINDGAGGILKKLGLTKERWEALRPGFIDAAQTVRGAGENACVTEREAEWRLLLSALDFKLLGRNDPRSAESLHNLALPTL
jgi:hypothetical protein